jgi:CelD/BcsL family acetyltransferase involved in cellulose biosynthesis
LTGHREEWDLLELTDLPSGSAQLPLLTSLFRPHLIACKNIYTICPYIDLSPTWDSIYNSFTPLLQNSIKRKLKKLNQFPPPHFVQVDRQENHAEYFNRFLEINKLRLKGKKIDSPFLDPRFLTFHRQILALLISKGMANLYFLTIDGEFIAGLYILIYNRRQYYYQSGFDPNWQHLSPGTLLLDHCIKGGHSQEMKEFDFLQGDEEYKKNWTTRQRINCKIIIFNKTFLGHIAPLTQIKFFVKAHFSNRRSS